MTWTYVWILLLFFYTSLTDYASTSIHSLNMYINHTLASHNIKHCQLHNIKHSQLHDFIERSVSFYQYSIMEYAIGSTLILSFV